MDKKLLNVVKRSQLSKFMAVIFMGVIFVCTAITGAYFNSSLSKNSSQISSLIDEVGSLSQSNFVLREQLTSQEAVLKSIEGDFSSLETALKSGNNDEIAGIFSGILSKLSTPSDAGKMTSDDVILSSVEDSTFDILLLGTNGAHTDTIVVASINVEKEKVTLFSIPRDLYINGRRINEYYYYYGVDQLERMVSSVTGLQIDKYAKVDLSGFEEIVDEIGGVDIYVDKALYDGYYPNGQGGYDPYSIEPGQYHMDGEEALRYARSRKSTTDFDRAGRQQKVLSALRTKVTQLDSIMEMKDLTEIFQTALSTTETDVDLLDAVSYYYDYRDFDLQTGFVLTSSNYLYSKINESGAYILLPRTNNFEEIQGVISDLVN